MKTTLTLLLLAVMLPFTIEAQLRVDVQLLYEITKASNAERKQLQQLQGLPMLQAAAHVEMSNASNQLFDLQKQYNEYLTKIQDTIAIAAQTYGMVIETRRLVSNLGELRRIISEHPTNTFAAALSTKSSNLYYEVGIKAIGIMEDLKQAVLEDSAHHSGHERLKMVLKIRPKLKDTSLSIRRLIRAIRYTTINDVLREIGLRSYELQSKEDIAQACLKRWKANGKKGTNSKDGWKEFFGENWQQIDENRIVGTINTNKIQK
ncbi:MAG: hypothetical protein LIP09_09720 [Bacteroidales bacterium]|nr:hypothetical protein [Bacteroidales bacterium]